METRRMTITEFLRARQSERLEEVNNLREIASSGQLYTGQGSFLARMAGQIERDVEAKRAIVDHSETLHRYAEKPRQPGLSTDTLPYYTLAAGASDVVLKHLASTFSDHKDFDPQWRVL